MKVTRRDFLKYCVGAAAVLGLEAPFLGNLEEVLAGGGTPVIWLNAANCSGCTVSLANRISTTKPLDLADLLINTINLAYHPVIMGAAGDLAVQTLKSASSSKFILAVEGGIPTAFNGNTCMLWTENGKTVTALAAVKQLAPLASAVLSIGTCASFGGIPGGNPNPTGIKTVKAVTGINTINIPGCPTHPDWVVWTIAQLLAGKNPARDSNGRPTTLFGKSVHSGCPRNGSDWAMAHGVDGLCLQNLGCKGPNTHGDCSTRLWNNKTNWCVGANAICLGCTESGFPDKFSPFYSSAGATPSGHKTTMQPCSSCHGSGGVSDGAAAATLPAGHKPVTQPCSACHG